MPPVKAATDVGRQCGCSLVYCEPSRLDYSARSIARTGCSWSTTSMYLHSDDLRRAKQIGGAFEAPAS